MLLESLYSASVVSHYVMTSSVAVAAGNAHYLDPGTGSLIIQIAIGAIAGGLVAAKVFWKRIGVSVARVFSRSSRLEHTQH